MHQLPIYNLSQLWRTRCNVQLELEVPSKTVKTHSKKKNLLKKYSIYSCDKDGKRMEDGIKLMHKTLDKVNKEKTCLVRLLCS